MKVEFYEKFRLSWFNGHYMQRNAVIGFRYREQFSIEITHCNKMVRRNVTLPNWLNFAAEREGINVSKVLQEALIEKFGMKPKVY